MHPMSRTYSTSSVVNLNSPISTPGNSSPKRPSVARSSSSESFASDKSEFNAAKPQQTELPDLPANIKETPVKANWRTSLESKINGGIAAIKAFGAKAKDKLTQTYELAKEMLHEVGTFLANLGSTLMGLARPQPQAEEPAAAPAAAPKSPVQAPVDLGPAVEAAHKDVN